MVMYVKHNTVAAGERSGASKASVVATAAVELIHIHKSRVALKHV